MVHLRMTFHGAVCYKVTSIKNTKLLVLSFRSFSSFWKPSTCNETRNGVSKPLVTGLGSKLKLTLQACFVKLGKDEDKIGNKEEYWKFVLWTVILNLDRILNFMHRITFDIRWYKVFFPGWKNSALKISRTFSTTKVTLWGPLKLSCKNIMLRVIFYSITAFYLQYHRNAKVC